MSVYSHMPQLVSTLGREEDEPIKLIARFSYMRRSPYSSIEV